LQVTHLSQQECKRSLYYFPDTARKIKRADMPQLALTTIFKPVEEPKFLSVTPYSTISHVLEASPVDP
uniref:Uncharacterized protein n=1 Tax=Amphimedon queenslandica TaxID=400682 RepID=A0A1X7TML0_AMPQE